MRGGAVAGMRVRWRRWRWARIAAIAGMAACTALTGAATAANASINEDAAALTYDEAPAVPRRTVAIVFGAKIEADGTPSPALAERVRGAVDLYRAGRVSHLLMTGDNRFAAYDEVTAMRAAAMAAGVPAAAITRDYAGLDTYDSCVRARTIFGVADAVLVTQAFHLPRALYLCRHHGIDAVGLAVPDWQHHPERAHPYTRDKQVSYTVREWIARANATVEAEIWHRAPAIGGPYEGLGED